MSLVVTATKKCTLKFADEAGKTARMDFYTAHANTDPAGVPYMNLANMTQTISDAAITEVMVSRYAVEDDPEDATDGPFASGLDKLEMSFVGEDGSPVRINFPGPNEAVFLDGSPVVDPSNSDIIALIDAIKDNCLTAEGTEIKAFTGGFRRSPSGVKRGI